MPDDRQNFEAIIIGLKTKADKIRTLFKAGYGRKEIADLMDIRYQHVRNVLVASGLEGVNPIKTPEIDEIAAIVPLQRKDRAPFSWERLLRAGFQFAGEWTMTEGVLALDTKISKLPGVYALIMDDEVVYIGVTLNGLQTRMDQYRRGHSRQKTSARVNKLIMEGIGQGRRIKVLVAMPPAFEWNGLPVHGAAGLEIALIDLIRPKWNIRSAGIV